MNKQENQESNKPQSLLEDLTINPDQAAEVKGGDHKNWINVQSCKIGGYK